jgi:hypothetical protein
MLEPTVTIAEPLTFAEDESLESEIGRSIPKLTRIGAAFRRNESGDGELSAQNLGNLLRRLSIPPMGEIANLISELQTLRKKPTNRWRPHSTRDSGTCRTEPAGNATNYDYLRQCEKTAAVFGSIGTSR